MPDTPDTDPWMQALREDAATIETVRVDEGARQPLVEAQTSGRARVRIISPGTGSTAHYTAEVLQEAARNRVIPAGTHMHLDHPTLTERSERPERSVGTLAGVTLTDAVWEVDGLYADIQTLPPFRDRFADLAPHIGVSIRGAGEVTSERIEGRPVLARLATVESVDFVTRAGRGGAVVSLLESADGPVTVEEARNAGQWFESRIHRDFTVLADDLAGDGHLTREERIALSGAIGDALTAFNARVAADVPQLYERDPYDQPPAPTPTVTTEENRMPEISQEELDRLRAVEAENATLRTDNERLEEANGTLRARDLQRTARDHATAALTADGAPELSERARARVIDQVCTAEMPVTESGALDTAALTVRVTEAAQAEATYLAEAIGETSGDGRPVGVGGGKSTTQLTEADLDRRSASIFGRTIKES